LAKLELSSPPNFEKKYGDQNVIASDIVKATKDFRKLGPFVHLDVTDLKEYMRVVVDHDIDWVIHNSSVLSASGERNPQWALDLNVKGVQNAMEVAQKHQLRIFVPSSIAAFGTSTPKVSTPNLTIQRPSTIYGVTKVYLELLGSYYTTKYNVDFRSLRYPGIISSETLPGGGTTDYAVEIYYEALKKGEFSCFLSEDSELPMMYMPDCLKATIKLLEAPASTLSERVYNVSGVSFTPKQIADSIKKYMKDFQIKYNPDPLRQGIANSWPRSLDDSLARKDWGWKHDFDLDAMTRDMLTKLSKRLQTENPNLKLREFRL